MDDKHEEEVIFDMETQDPDDCLTLIWLLAHPQIKLRAVTISPGSMHQVGVVKHVLSRLGKGMIPVGAGNIDHAKACVSAWHYKVFGDIPPCSDALPAVDVLEQFATTTTTILTGGPLRNVAQFLRKNPERMLNRLVIQGGFAGDNIVPPEHRLKKFSGRETCPTWNMNCDPQSALEVLCSPQIGKRFCVSKNVCHGICYSQELQAKLQRAHRSEAMDIIFEGLAGYRTGEYLDQTGRSSGKALHDLLAAAVVLESRVCNFAPVERYRKGNEWGSRPKPDSNTFISISCDEALFHELFLAPCLPSQRQDKGMEPCAAETSPAPRKRSRLQHANQAGAHPTGKAANPASEGARPVVKATAQRQHNIDARYGNINVTTVASDVPAAAVDLARQVFATCEPKPGGRGVYVRFPVPPTVTQWFRAPFKFHSLEPADGTVTVTTWLSESGEPAPLASKIPEASTSIQGTAILLADTTGELLFVRELRFGGRLKFVSGAVDKGESALQAGLREVREETGLDVTWNDCDMATLRYLGGWNFPNARPGKIADNFVTLGVKLKNPLDISRAKAEAGEVASVHKFPPEAVLADADCRPAERQFMDGCATIARRWATDTGFPVTIDHRGKLSW
eukprot:TRINITY_DN18716_c0_g1_i1.p1 TRINITY_DN18716_c0_g1~~TRINITY_DN18716_c0_g1_i1.p1  ORF type:complete len:636 (+),score=75.28 TRINITY_DN18716_c0_g1_i1:43-1908(+)